MRSAAPGPGACCPTTGVRPAATAAPPGWRDVDHAVAGLEVDVALEAVGGPLDRMQAGARIDPRRGTASARCGSAARPRMSPRTSSAAKWMGGRTGGTRRSAAWTSSCTQRRRWRWRTRQVSTSGAVAPGRRRRWPRWRRSTRRCPTTGTAAADTLRLLDRVGGPATMATTGGRYFGFVIGATPAGGAGRRVDRRRVGPERRAAGDVAGRGPAARRRLALAGRCAAACPRTPAWRSSAAPPSPTPSCLAAARDELLAAAGWDVQADGLFGAPPISVVVGERAHSTLSKSLGLVGLGRDRVLVVPADDQGRLRADELPGPGTGRCWSARRPAR